MAQAKTGWRLIFVKGLLHNFLDGEVCLDFRKYRPDSNHFKKSQIIEGHFLEGISILLQVTEPTRVKLFSEITDDERDEWGIFAQPATSHEQMMQTMQGFYPGLTGDDTVAINFLQLPKIAGRPIAGPV